MKKFELYLLSASAILFAAIFAAGCSDSPSVAGTAEEPNELAIELESSSSAEEPSSSEAVSSSGVTVSSSSVYSSSAAVSSSGTVQSSSSVVESSSSRTVESSSDVVMSSSGKQQGGNDSGNNILDPTSLDFVLKAFGIEDYTFDSNVLALHTIVGNEGSNSPPMATEFDGPGLHPIVQQNIGALEEFFPEAAKEQAGLIDSIVNGYMGDSCKLYMANIWDTDNNAVAYIVADIGKDTLTVVDVVMDGCEKSVASGDPRALVYYCGKINRRPTEVHIPVNASANGMRCENIPNNEMTKK